MEEGDVTWRIARLLKSKESVKIEVSCYGGSLGVEEFIDWLSEMEKDFEFERMETTSET
jgi:hypothetical protein